MSELFQISPSLSPRLLWMERHGITVRPTGDAGLPGCTLPWIAEQASSMRYAYGQTETEACEELGRKLGLQHWSFA